MRTAACAAITLIAVTFTRAQTVDLPSLLAELDDLRALSLAPDPPFVCKQHSSYDPASTTPDDPASWFANGDAGNYIRVEDRAGRREFVLHDAQGPGAVVRIWSPNPAGTLRIYIDEQDTPVIEAAMADVLVGNFRGIPAPLACETSRGWNCYLPIPYARHCKITSDAKGMYYHVGYRTYPASVQVRSFDADMLREHSTAIFAAASRLAFTAPAKPAKEAETREAAIAPGAELVLAELTGPIAVTALRTLVHADDLPLALRQVVLTIDFDGKRCVEAPIGDFYGSAPGVNPYESLPSGVLADGTMWCRWWMPCEKTARVALRNLGAQPATVRHVTETAQCAWTRRSMHFHAKWRGQFAVPTRPMIDWNYLTCTGSGAFVGVAFNIANPTKLWWGEGDEKIYVDAEKFPSYFGTGTEDYYGYGWCHPVLFNHAYRNQTRCDGPGNYGHTSVNRWHVIDRIPFTREFRFDMELWHWNAAVDVDMAVTAYWYAMPGGGDAFAALTPELLQLNTLPKFVPFKVAGAIEGEDMKIVSAAGQHEVQSLDGCSNEAHRWWKGGTKPGDKLTLGFNAPSPGRYRVFARFMRARDYGIIQLRINDRNAREPIDFYNDAIAPTDEIELGEFDLGAENQLSAEIVGANEKAVKSYMLGLDYVRLEPAPTKR